MEQAQGLCRVEARALWQGICKHFNSKAAYVLRILDEVLKIDADRFAISNCSSIGWRVGRSGCLVASMDRENANSTNFMDAF